MQSPTRFSRIVLGRPLRRYQAEIAESIAGAVLRDEGGRFAVMLPRQSGKNEISAHIEAFLMSLCRRTGGDCVKASPSFDPQSLRSLQRLQDVFAGSIIGSATRETAHSLKFGRARCHFLSTARGSRVVGATASVLLEADEAQDIDEDRWQKEFRPMGASADVCSVLWGTAWTSGTLLAKTIRELRQSERAGLRSVASTASRAAGKSVHVVSWERVADEVPPYGRYVESEIERLGPTHPLIMTQYLLQEIALEGGMFTPATRALMHGQHSSRVTPEEGREYILLIDVAGPDELRLEGMLTNPSESRRDGTAATICEISRGPSGLATYRAVYRWLDIGSPHRQLYGVLVTLAETWRCRRIVVDATGVGAGVASWLVAELGDRVLPFLFTSVSKSTLGWTFLGICNSGRWLDYRDDGSDEYKTFWQQVTHAVMVVAEGEARRIKWGVTQAGMHDDLLMSAALVGAIDEELSRPPQDSYIVEAPDVLDQRIPWDE